MRFCFLLLLAILIAGPAHSQVIITGSVEDGVTGETLPSATVLLEGSYRGTITNTQGVFTLSVEELPAAFRISYIGYYTRRVVVDESSSLPLEVRLEPAVTEMDPVVVTDRDPAMSIMERVIARKQEWRTGLENYRVEAYSRQVLSSDTAIVSITESRSVAWWHALHGHREIQLARRQTSNLQDDQNFAGIRNLPNFYDDDVEIAGFRILGITHPDAMRYYDFRLLETSRIDDRPVYRIEVIPRRPRQPLFEGTAWVLGEEYVLLEVELIPNEVVHFPPPVRELELAYSQQYSNFGGDFWLPVDMRIDGLIRIGMVGLQFPRMHFRQVSRLSDYEINTAIPDSIFEEREEFVRIDAEREGTVVRDFDPIPLTVEEEQAYETIDSTATIRQAFEPRGFLSRMVELGERAEDEGPGTFLNRFLPRGLGVTGRFNRVDGFNVGLRYTNDLTETTWWTVMGSYSFHSEKWDYGFEVEQLFHRFDEYEAGLFGGYRNATEPRYRSGLYSFGINSLATLAGTQDYFDYFRNERAYAGIRMRNLFPETTLSLQVNMEKHRSFTAGEELDYSLFGLHEPRRVNPDIPEGKLNSFQSTLNVSRPGATFGFAGNTGFEITGEWSDERFGSDFNFFRLALDVDVSLRTFYPRRLFSNTLDVQFSAGLAAGTLPLQRFGTVDGNIFRFTPFGSLRTRRALPYEGSDYWMLAAEHNFGTLPFELLEIRGLVRRGWGILVFGAMGQASAPRALSGAAGQSPAPGIPSGGLMTSDGVHSEIGISLNRIFGILRIDYAQRLDERGYFIGLSVPRYF